MKIRTFFRVLIFLVVLILLVILIHKPILLTVGNFLLVNEPLKRADVVRVLGGHPERYIYGIGLYKKGYGSKLVLSMHEGFDPLLQRTNIEIIRDFALSQQIPEEDIIFFSAGSTYEEAVLTRKLIRKHKIKSLLIISSPFHMRRVTLAFEHVIGNEAKLVFSSVPFSKSEYQKIWWTDEDSITAVVHEYVSLIYYYFKYFPPF